MNQTEEKILNFIAIEAAGKIAADFGIETELIDSGILDSLLMMSVITFLEKEYRVEFGIKEIVPRNFRSIGTLAAFVDAKAGGQAA